MMSGKYCSSLANEIHSRYFEVECRVFYNMQTCTEKAPSDFVCVKCEVDHIMAFYNLTLSYQYFK